MYENNIPDFEIYPFEYEDLISLYDELRCLKNNFYALLEWRKKKSLF